MFYLTEYREIKKSLTLWSIILLVCFFLPSKATAGEPTEQVRQSVEEIRSVFRDKELSRPENKKERNAQLRRIVEFRFDFEEMSKRSLGIHWRKRTPEERKEFVALYKDLLEDVYLRKLERHDSEIKEHLEDRVVYLDERVENSYALVRTNIVTKKEVTIPIEYKLLKKGNKWEVYDVVIEGVSLVNNYRNQINSIIRSNSYEELVKRLKNKTIKGPS